MNSSEILESLKRRLKREKRLWNTTGVYVPIFNVKFLFYIKSSNFPISINLANPLRKTIYLQMYPKITKNIYKTTQNIDMWDEQRDS